MFNILIYLFNPSLDYPIDYLNDMSRSPLNRLIKVVSNREVKKT